MSEQQLRKALGAVNDLHPPRDDLFVDRAVTRGRARAYRRRSAIVGAAAAVVLVGGLGGTWVAGQGHDGTASSAGGSAPQVAAQSPGDNTFGSAAAAPSEAMPPARDLSGWFTGTMTPLRAAMETLAPTLEARFPDVFAGMYAADAGNTRIVLCVTRSDAELERMVGSALPAGTETGVTYQTVPHSIRQLRDAVTTIDAHRMTLQARGITVLRMDVAAKANRVVVTTMQDPGTAIADLVGADLVTIVVDDSHTPRPMFPGGSPVTPLR